MTTPEIAVKTEVDFDFIANYNGDENTQNSQSSNSSRILRNSYAAGSNQQQQQQQQRPQQTALETNIESDDYNLLKLLKEFDLEILYTSLKLADISYRSLRYLSTEDINAAIRNIGYRAEFREKLFIWRKNKYESDDSAVCNNTAALNTIHTASNANKKLPTTAVAPAISMQQQQQQQQQQSTAVATTTANVLPTTSTASATIIKRTAPEDFLSLLPGVSGATARISNTPTVILEPTMDLKHAFSFIPKTTKPTQTAVTATVTATTQQQQQQQQQQTNLLVPVASLSNNNNNEGYLPKGLLIMSCTKVHVQNVLENTHIGRTIKQFYNKNGYLENQQRNEIVRLIIEEVMQQGESLSPKDFRAIMHDIITVFPNEKAAADYYFIYRCGKGNPLGRLYQRYSNENSKRRKLTRLAEDEDTSDGGGGGGGSGGVVGASEQHVGLMDDDDTMSTYPQELPGRVPRVDEMTALALKQLLTTDHFSWEEVCDKWIQTWALRQKEMQQTGLAELLTNWAKLADPRAAELFKIDFRHVYPNKENLLFAKWEDYVKKIGAQFDKKLNYEDLKKLYKYCKMGMASKDEKDFIFAAGLTALLPSTARFKDHTGKLKIRANIGDSIDSFVMRLNTLDAYESHLDLYNRKYGPINRSTHPFLVVIMPNEYTISKIYVALENHFYCMQSFLQALDLCYKIYHTCGLKYPTICENVWTFIQRYFYDMTVPWEARNANLVSLMMSLTMQT